MIQIGRRWCRLAAPVPRVDSLVRGRPLFGNTVPMLWMLIHPGLPLAGVASLVELPTVQPPSLQKVFEATTVYHRLDTVPGQCAAAQSTNILPIHPNRRRDVSLHKFLDPFLEGCYRQRPRLDLRLAEGCHSLRALLVGWAEGEHNYIG